MLRLRLPELISNAEINNLARHGISNVTPLMLS